MSQQSFRPLCFPLSRLVHLEALIVEVAVIAALGTSLFTSLSFICSDRASAEAVAVSSEQIMSINASAASTSAADLGVVEVQINNPLEFDCLISASETDRPSCSSLGGSFALITDEIEVPLDLPRRNADAISVYFDLLNSKTGSSDRLILFELGISF